MTERPKCLQVGQHPGNRLRISVVDDFTDILRIRGVQMTDRFVQIQTDDPETGSEKRLYRRPANSPCSACNQHDPVAHDGHLITVCPPSTTRV